MLNKSQLEVFVESYVKPRKRNKVGVRFIRKALALINQKLNDPCCDDPNAVVHLYTPEENDLTQAVRAILAGTPKLGNVNSLTRAYNKLQRFYDCCYVAPAGPTAPVVNDSANTFDFTFAIGAPTLDRYEQTLDGGSTYTSLSAKPITGITGTKLVNTVGVRVKATATKPPSATLYNNVPFTVTPATPTSPVTDDSANSFDWTYSSGFTSPSNYEYTVNSGSSYSAVTVKPITGLTGAHGIGTVGVRVKAISPNPASLTLYNSVAFT